MHTTIETKTSLHRPLHVKSVGKALRPQSWRPHQVGLSRDELRRIVLDQLG